MAKIKKVEFAIGSALTGGTSVAYSVKVKLTLDFNRSEDGRKFNFRINLYEAGAGDITDSTPPIYKFKFGSSLAKGVTATFPVQQLIFNESRFVSSKVLDVKPSLPGQPPVEDKIRAGVILRSGGVGQIGVLVDFKTSNLQVVKAEQFG